MKRTTISLPDDLATLVRNEALRRRTSVSDVVRLSLVKSLGVETQRDIPWAAICDDPGMVRAASLEEGLEGWENDLDRRGR